MIVDSDVVTIQLSIFELQTIIGNAVEKAIDSKLGSIESDDHRRHHEWMERILNWGDRMGQDVLGTIVRSIIMGIIFLIVLGFGLWVKAKGI